MPRGGNRSNLDLTNFRSYIATRSHYTAEAIAAAWRRNWTAVIPFFAFPDEVRRIIYTTNAIEALNAKLRSAVRTRGHFPTDEAALKLLYLVLNRTEREWRMPAREWAMAKAQFAVLFGQRFSKALA